MKRKIATKPRKLPSQSRSRETVDAILEATARVLVSRGYEKATTNHIAATAGVSIGSLYQYFPSKDALVGGVIDRHMAEVTELVRAGFARVADAPMMSAARELVGAMIDAHALSPKLHQVLAENTARVGRQGNLASIDSENHRLVRLYLEAHRSELHVADLGLATMICATVVEALTHNTVIHRPELVTGENRDVFVNEVANLLIRYLTVS